MRICMFLPAGSGYNYSSGIQRSMAVPIVKRLASNDLRNKPVKKCSKMNSCVRI